MCRNSLRVTCVLGALGVFSTFLSTGTKESVAADQDLRQAFDDVHRAVVRVVDEDHPAGHRGIGVVVTVEGHVVMHATPHLAKLPLLFIFPDGRRARGRLLGWSEEWNVSLAKIVDAGPWPFVTMDTSAERLKAKQPCFTVGYSLLADGWKADPEQRIGEITRPDASAWFSSSLQESNGDKPLFKYGPVFDADGKLLGNTLNVRLRGGSDHLRGHQIQALWKQLLEPGNLDKRRLSHLSADLDAGRPYQVQVGEPESIPDAEKRIVACTVEVNGKEGTVCGVVVSPDGWILTCEHGKSLPGDRVRVTFADGRSTAAVVTGTNPASDVALVKITEGGPWPFVPLADSTRVEPGTPCWVVGYPADGASDRPAHQPLARKTTVATRKEPEWSYRLFTASSYDQWPGDSGGGVFDLSGRLLAITEGKEAGYIGRHPRVEVFRVQWQSLAGSDPK
jgi:S1-C subfamily serine protease